MLRPIWAEKQEPANFHFVVQKYAQGRRKLCARFWSRIAAEAINPPHACVLETEKPEIWWLEGSRNLFSGVGK